MSAPTSLSITEVPAAVDVTLRRFFADAVPTAATIAPVVGAAATTVRDFVLHGGKRIRPTFAYAGWLCGRSSSSPGPAVTADHALRVCAALELVQACALIHDDVIDRSDTRRGRPTLHRQFERDHIEAGWSGDAGHHGVSAAILAGDLALSWADDLVHGHCPVPDKASDPAGIGEVTALPTAVGRTWASMRTEVLGGQLLDIVNEAAGDESVEAAYRVMEFKTAAYTVSRPLELGARLAGATEALVADLRSVGHDLGIAFQLRDDLLGVFGDPSRTGKPSGDDLVSGKRTVLIATAIGRADDLDVRRGHELRGLLGRELDAEQLSAARALLIDLGAVDETEDRIHARLESALATLAAADIGADIRTELAALARRTAYREM